jgi:hypothetical protein
MIRIAFVIGDYPPEQRRRREDVARVRTQGANNGTASDLFQPLLDDVG